MRFRNFGLMLGLAVIVMLAVASAACGSDDDGSAPELEQPDTTGRELADEFLTLLKDKDMDGLQDFLSDAFIIQRADGSFATKEEYLTKLPEIREYTIQGVTAKQDGSALTVKWEVVVEEMIDGRTYSAQPAPRLSTFTWDSDRWQMTGHANFNAPVTATPAR